MCVPHFIAIHPMVIRTLKTINVTLMVALENMSAGLIGSIHHAGSMVFRTKCHVGQTNTTPRAK